ncbi:MAG: ribosylnicotinamide kinase [Peltula sp. TS41687]|nr:MAG: ribosylnicotinamide kinase [Peltula sp. TS41687]
MSTSQSQTTIIVGISGSSSSGKTTLSRLLRGIFPVSFILHQDDFYKPDELIPLTKDGLQDWDCVESLDIPGLLASLEYIHAHGAIPPSLVSKEDQNPINPNSNNAVSPSTISRLKALVSDHLAGQGRHTLAILDGFLLYGSSASSVREMLDVKLFLRTKSFGEAKRRRESREGYVTLDGFWKDPPGYMDKIVWPAYVREHALLFEDGDVQGTYDQDVLGKLGIRVLDKEEEDEGLEKLLQWAVGVILEEWDKSRGTR